MRLNRILRTIFADIPESHNRIRLAYEILDLPLDAPKKTIHRAYIKQAKKYHPDMNSGLTEEEQTELFQNISNAYEILMGKCNDLDLDSESGEVDYGEENFDGYEKIASIAYAKDILGVDPNASEQEVDNAYKILALKYHPDINDELSEEEKNYFETLTEAYRTFKRQYSMTRTQRLYQKQIENSRYVRPDFWQTGEDEKPRKLNFSILTTNYEPDNGLSDNEVVSYSKKSPWWKVI